ncbi:MAG: hypothetical protein AAGL08_19040 [Cyanobacteria bacterium J06573_11]
MDKGENNNEPKRELSFNRIVAPIVTALVVGGTAPWWVELVKEGELGSVERDSVSENISGESESPKVSDHNSSIGVQGSEAIVSGSSTIASDSSTIASGNSNVAGENSTIASDQALVQNNYGSGPNISADRDVHYNEAPESLETVQDSVALALNRGLPYEEARQILIDKGWQPITPITVGGFPNMNDPTIDYIFNERGYQEVEGCSGSSLGLCLFKFSNGMGKKLSVQTINNQRGGWKGQDITVWSWSFINE